MSLAFDEYGRPYLIIRDQGSKSRIKGLAAQKVSARACPNDSLPPSHTSFTITLSWPGKHLGSTHSLQHSANFSWSQG